MANGQIIIERSPAIAPNAFYRINVIDNGDNTVSLYVEERANSDAKSNAAAVTATGLPVVPPGGGGGVTGSGTTNVLSKWTNGPGSVLGDSRVTDILAGNFTVEVPNHQIILGDPSGAGNATALKLDDAAQIVSIVNASVGIGTVSPQTFFDVESGAAESLFSNNWGGNNTVAVWNQNTAGYSAYRAQNSSGQERMAIGYGNSTSGGGANYPFASAAYWESNGYVIGTYAVPVADTALAPTPMRFVTSGNINSRFAFYTRASFENDGHFYLYDLTGGSGDTNFTGGGVKLWDFNGLTGAIIHKSASASALVIGPNGATNPTFAIDASTASAATGVKITSAASGSGVTLATTTSGTNENLNISPAGNGLINIINNGSTQITLSPLGSNNASIVFKTSGSQRYQLSVLDSDRSFRLFSSGVLADTFVVSSAGLTTVQAVDAATNTITNSLTLKHNSSGTPTTGFGNGFRFQGQSSTTADRDMGLIAPLWTTATDASRTSDLVFYTVNNAAALAEAGRFTGAKDFNVIGGILTADPTAGAGPLWKLGTRKAATVVLDTTQYIEVDLGGTIYKLAIVN